MKVLIKKSKKILEDLNDLQKGGQKLWFESLPAESIHDYNIAYHKLKIFIDNLPEPKTKK